jgi:ribosomal protein S12 methylthiotransferase
MKKQSVYFVSLGCPKNRVDTEVMLGLSDRAGFTIARAPDQADAIVINTCGFIGEAKEESIDTILEMARYKSDGKAKRLVVTGCLTQRYAGDLARDLPEVDTFLGSGDVDKIVGALRGEGPRDGVTLDPAYLYDDVTPRLQSLPAYTAYVKIAEGCDRPCSFCIIPKLRGGQRSRAPESVEREVRDLVARGAVEINLVAQDLTTYGKDLDGELQLASLVRRLGAVDGLRWLRLHYAFPTATTDELLDAVAEEARVAKYIDMPLQHVDDQMLKHMRRGHVGKTVRLRARGRVRSCRRVHLLRRGGHALGQARARARRDSAKGDGAAAPRADAHPAHDFAQKDESDGGARAGRARRGAER